MRAEGELRADRTDELMRAVGRLMRQALRMLNRLSLSATIHCLTACAIGEVLGMILATWWRWHDVASIALAISPSPSSSATP